MSAHHYLKNRDKIVLKNSKQRVLLGSKGMELQSGYYVQYKEDYTFDFSHLYPNMNEELFSVPSFDVHQVEIVLCIQQVAISATAPTIEARQRARIAKMAKRIK